ncbi:phosphoribosyl-AMP cyclohydrolase [Halomonas sp. PR-M31]|uniref:phosphoribosyl-AMP cyclohydrolase n=1 Tax=Halomonas sp. PR-M31 TaxID=1471202 RepID=UPI000650CBE5|nr:phosphoribosyl-AMP cyclohydrolase [Halomonas sp. PR-M31]
MSDLFKHLETAESGTRRSLSPLLDAVRWNADGLIPAIAQQHDSGEVLMLAWMSRQSLEETLHSGRVCYWSRSRCKLWRKGESSGQTQHLKSAYLDCDGDTLLLSVEQTGPACHTGRRSCFYVALDDEHGQVDTKPLIDPSALYGSKD